MAFIDGTSGRDRLVGTIFSDFISAFGGNDTIIGSQGFDSVDGGSGFDIINYSNLSEAITLKPAGEIDKGSLGVDNLFSIERIIAPRNQFNVIDASTTSASTNTSIFVNLRTNKLKVRNIPGVGTLTIGVNNFIDVVGTENNDVIEGDEQSNFFFGEGGNDVFRGSEGFDFIDGGSGTDTANYSRLDGPITLKPAGEIDKGVLGTDTLFLVERVIAPVGEFNDIDASTATGDVSISASLLKKKLTVRDIPGLGNRTLTVINFIDVTGTEQGDVIEGDNDSNILTGLGGNDLFKGTRGFDFIDGGDGFDVINYSNLSNGITLKSIGEIDKGSAGSDTLFRVDRIIAPVGEVNTVDASDSSGVFVEINLAGRFLNVSNVPNVGFLSFGINNFIDAIGSQSGDVITGSSLSNFIDGQNGDDFITATRGNDFISGGDGFDTLDYSQLGTAITILPAGVIQKAGSAGVDTAFLVERFIGAVGRANAIDGSTASSGISFDVSLEFQFLDVLNVPGVGTINQFVENFVDVTGTSGSDFIEGSSGNNKLDGFFGDDDIFGGAGADRITGGFGNDFISGQNGNDIINGTNSIARGFGEIDSLQGGAGRDRFILGDEGGSFYKSTNFLDFDSFGFGGFQQVAFFGDFSSTDTIELGRGETYRAQATSVGFDLYVLNSGRFDAVAGVTTTSNISGLLPTGNFSLSAGQTLGVFVSA